MLGVEGDASSGMKFEVHTTSHRGWTPEELAEELWKSLLLLAIQQTPC